MATNNSINNTATTLSPTNVHTSNLSFDSGTNNMSAYSVTSFTPSLAIGGSTSGIAYAERSGTLIRIGKLGIILMNIDLGSKGSNSGDLKISTGITTNAASNKYFGFVGEDITLPVDGQSPMGELLSNDVFLYYSSNGGSIAPMDNTHIGNATSFYIQFSFLTT